MRERKAFFFIGIPLLVLMIGLGLFLGYVLSPQNRQTNYNQLIEPTITPVPIQIPSQSLQPKPPVIYPTNDLEHFIQVAKNAETISQSDNTTRKKLIQSMDASSEIVQQTPAYTLYYRPVSNLFDTLLTVPNLQQAKVAAIAWLQSQGLTQDGICKLPITFFPSSDVSQQLQGKGIRFNPLPDGC